MATKKQRAHLDLQQNELQNVKGHNLNATPQDVVESQFWYDTVNHRFKFHNGAAVKDFGKEYTAGTGIDISDETIYVEDYNKILKNNIPTSYLDRNSLSILGQSTASTGSILIGKHTNMQADYSIAIGDSAYTLNKYDTAIGADAKTYQLYNSTNSSAKNVAVGYDAQVGSGTDAGATQGTAIGSETRAKGNNSTAIGSGASAYENGLAVGKSSSAAQDALAVGFFASANNTNAIQIGNGTNNTANTLAIGFGYDNSQNAIEYTLLDGATGLIPDDRISSNIARASAIPTTVAELSDSSKYALKSDLTTAYKAAGTVASASDLPTLSASVLGNVYNVTASFTTTSDFVEGSGKTIQIGNDIAVVDVGTSSSHSYKFSVMGDFIDISGKQDASTAVTHTASTAVGSTTNPVYIASDGTATATTYTLGKSVPSDAVFTDTKANWNETDTTSAAYIQNKPTILSKLTASNTALTASGGEVTWTITNSIGTKYVGIHVYETSTGEDVTSSVSITVSANTITIKMNSTSNIAANTYYAVIIG